MINFIVNPVSGNGRALDTAKKVESLLVSKGITFSMHFTTERNQASKLVKDLLEKGADTIVAVGGDGTVLECAQGIFYSDSIYKNSVSFGIIPAGSGNDFARTLNIPDNIKSAMDIVFKNKTIKCDMLEINGLPVVNIASVGLDAEIVKKSKSMRRYFGKLSYAVSAVSEIFSYKSLDATIITDGEKISSKFTLIAICNGRYYGGGFKISPKSDIADGLINLVYAENLSKIQLMILLPLVPFGLHTMLKAVKVKKCRQLNIEYDNGYCFNIDGNLIETGGKVDAKIHPSVINIIHNII